MSRGPGTEKALKKAHNRVILLSRSSRKSQAKFKWEFRMKTQRTWSTTFFRFLFLLSIVLFLTVLGYSQAQDPKTDPAAKAESPPMTQFLTKTGATLVVTGSTRGEFEPCGCGGVYEGGFSRRSTLLQKMRTVNPNLILLDTGDTTNSEEVSQTEFIFQAYGLLGYDAIALGEGDLRVGLEAFGRYAKKYHLPFVASNVKFKSPTCLPEVIGLKRAGHKIAVISILAEHWLATLPTGLRNQITYEPPASALARLLPELRKRYDTIILISHFGQKVRETLAGQLKGIDLWIDSGGHQKAAATQPLNPTQPATAKAKSREDDFFFPDRIPPLLVAWQNDRKVGIVGIQWRNHQLDFNPAPRTMISLAKSMVEDKKFLDIYDANKYAARQEMIKKLMNSLGTQNSPAAFQYVSSEKCGTCHQDIYEFWKTTKHAQAFMTLKKGNRDADINCWTCHTTGYREEGGFDNPVSTPNLVNVGCQDCHKKNLRDHPRKDRTTATQTIPLQGFQGNLTKSWHCERCHVPHRSPKYEYQSYLKRIACPQALEKEEATKSK
jgi:hypothetical protein